MYKSPNSLAAQIIKAKYYPKGSFLEAKHCKGRSIAWKSIVDAADLAGLFWRVGDGKDIRIWGDKWYPRPVTFSIQSPRVSLNEVAMVVDLIDPVAAEWKSELIREKFLEDEANTICNIPLSRYGQRDKLIWRATPTGIFTVRSAYYLELVKRALKEGGGSRTMKINTPWKSIWSLNVPNSTKMFIWRACSNILPTEDNLRRKGVISEEDCMFSGREVESAKHILWDCL